MIEVRDQRTNTALIKPLIKLLIKPLVIMSAMLLDDAPLPATVLEESPQTKDLFDIDSDSDSEEEKEYTAKEVLVGCDQTLRWAFATVSRQLADKWRSYIDGVHPDSLESHRPRFKTEKHWAKIQRRLGEEFKKSSRSDVPEDKLKEVKKQVDDHKDEIFDTIIDLIFKPIQDSSQEASFSKTSPQEQRKRVNRTLKLMKQRATCYELLGVERDATEKQIKAAWKQIIGGLHPDQNKDKSAQECAQAVNAARDVLCDREKRTIYDTFIENTPRPKAEDLFDEEFNSNAFDEDDSDAMSEEDDEEDSEDDDEKTYPRPSKQIQKVYGHMTSRIKAFFNDLEGPINFSKLDTIDKLNKAIVKDNQKYKRAVLTLYEVPRQRLLFFQYAQRRILIGFKTGEFDIFKVQKEMHWLQEQFIKTRTRGLYQWPGTWTQLLMEPLHQKLESIGLPREQQMPAEETPGTGSKNHKVSAENEDEDEDEDEEMEEPNPNRQIQPLRPGFTILGDPILGYLPIRRRSKVMAGETIILGFRVFVKVDGVNPLQVAGGSEIGDAAALAYHQLPEHEKNDVGQNAAKYATMPATEFVEIIGVTWVPGSSRSDRLPITYVWARTRADSGKAEIMTRTTFRQWIGTSLADKYIDSFLVDKGITPEWAALGFSTDPANDSKYLRLTYPPPRQAAHYNLRPRIQNGGFPALQNGGFQGYPTLQNSSGLQGLPASQREGGGVHDLTSKFDQLMELFIRGQEEAREDRKQQREIMSRLLPAP